MSQDRVSKNQIRKAGDNLAAGLPDGVERREALDLVGYWRTAHIEPLQRTLEMLECVCEQDPSTMLVGRLKRIDTIIGKLKRPGQNFKLNTLQDIAGCRLIVPTDDDVRTIVAQIKETGQCEKSRDYIEKPKSSGYRGIHLVCRHDSPEYGYKNLNVEVQVRSGLQHVWATAVEMYDLITESNLKFDSGSPEEKRYFQLVAALMNHCVEDEVESIEELKRLDAELDILNMFKEASDSMYVIDDGVNEISRSDSCLITVNLEQQLIELKVYSREKEENAASDYTKLESEARQENKDSMNNVYLLARAASLDDLRRAYPNYYTGISSFIEWLESRIR